VERSDHTTTSTGGPDETIPRLYDENKSSRNENNENNENKKAIVSFVAVA